MSRIQSTFAALTAQNKKALITFITAGDPSPALTVPFSDPMAEGPVIQRACERALKFNIGLRDVFAFVREFRLSNSTTPVVLMGYANPIERMGMDRFIASALEAGVDGTIVV